MPRLVRGILFGHPDNHRGRWQMDWMAIVGAIAFGMFAIYLFPRVKQALRDSPEGSSSDWMSAIIPLAFVGGFVILLVMMV